MKVKVTGIQETKAYIKERAERMAKEYLSELDKLAMDVVTAIRTSEVSFWNDVTGNLRSSIGYKIVRDGETMFENFQICNGGGAEGMQKAKSYAQELASKYHKGVVVVIVAGMEYASYVEDVESRVVLKGGELLAENKLQKLDAKWKSMIGK